MGSRGRVFPHIFGNLDSVLRPLLYNQIKLLQVTHIALRRRMLSDHKNAQWLVDPLLFSRYFPSLKEQGCLQACQALRHTARPHAMRP